MVDKLLAVEGDEAQTSLRVRRNNYFISYDKLMAVTGLMEHIAQSASAFAGYTALQAGAKKPPVGLIGEVKHFECVRRPAVGELLTTHITKLIEVDGIAIVSGETRSAEQLVATATLKIAIIQNDR